MQYCVKKTLLVLLTDTGDSGMDMALNEVTAVENGTHQSGDDPVVTRLQSRWKSAVQKASTQISAETTYTALDARDDSAFAQTSETMRKNEDVQPLNAAPPAVFASVQPRAWHTVRPSQLRKVDRRLARMQQAWLAPSINGCFILDEQSVEWRLSLPQPIIDPVVVLIGYQPMAVDESVDLPSGEALSHDTVAKPIGFSLSVGAESFLLNWIPAPWQTLGADAKHVLLQIALSPLVEAIGLALDDHWHVAAIEESREKNEQEIRGASAGELHFSSAGNSASVPDEAAKISIGVSFRCAGVDQIDTATLSVPEIWLERFLAQRHDAARFCSMRHLLAAYPNIGSMQHTLPVIVGELSLDAQSVRELETGDVIFFATHHGSLADLWHSSGLNARIDAPSATIKLTLNSSECNALVCDVFVRPLERFASSFLDISAADAPHFSFSRESDPIPMENTSTPDLVSPDAATAADHLATLPIAITIEVGELSMPLSALSDIAVGTTLALAKPLDEHLLTIRANGHAIAFGELVMLDSEVGVRVKRLASLAAPNINRVGSHVHDNSASTDTAPSTNAAMSTEDEHSLSA
jgi:type III secretion system YscQ/HrcQ family protein